MQSNTYRVTFKVHGAGQTALHTITVRAQNDSDATSKARAQAAYPAHFTVAVKTIAKTA